MHSKTLYITLYISVYLSSCNLKIILNHFCTIVCQTDSHTVQKFSFDSNNTFSENSGGAEAFKARAGGGGYRVPPARRPGADPSAVHHQRALRGPADHQRHGETKIGTRGD